MAVLSRLDIEISANSARFQQEIQNVSTTSRRAAAQLQREQQPPPLSVNPQDRKSTRLNSSHSAKSRMPSSA